MKSKMRLLLETLPTAPDDVAAYLTLQGIRGVRSHSTHCPVAMYLRANGVACVSVGPGKVEFYDEEERTWRRDPLPLGCALFVSAFDAGIYPRIEIEEHH